MPGRIVGSGCLVLVILLCAAAIAAALINPENLIPS